MWDCLGPLTASLPWHARTPARPHAGRSTAPGTAASSAGRRIRLWSREPRMAGPGPAEPRPLLGMARRHTRWARCAGPPRAASVGQPVRVPGAGRHPIQIVRGALAAARRCRRNDASRSSSRMATAAGHRASERCARARRVVRSVVFAGRTLGAARLHPHGLARHLRGADPRNDVLTCIKAGRRGAKSGRLSGERGGYRAGAPL